MCERGTEVNFSTSLGFLFNLILSVETKWQLHEGTCRNLIA